MTTGSTTAGPIASPPGRAAGPLLFLLRHVEDAVACLCLVVIAACVVLQVISRYVFHVGLVWTEDVAAFAMAWAVYMGAAVAVRERFHVRIVFCVTHLPRALGVLLTVFADALWLGFCVFMAWQGWIYLELLWTQVSYVASLGIDAKWPQTVIVLGNLLMGARMIELYVGWWRGGMIGYPSFVDEDAEPSV